MMRGLTGDGGWRGVCTIGLKPLSCLEISDGWGGCVPLTWGEDSFGSIVTSSALWYASFAKPLYCTTYISSYEVSRVLYGYHLLVLWFMGCFNILKVFLYLKLVCVGILERISTHVSQAVGKRGQVVGHKSVHIHFLRLCHCYHEHKLNPAKRYFWWKPLVQGIRDSLGHEWPSRVQMAAPGCDKYIKTHIILMENPVLVWSHGRGTTWPKGIEQTQKALSEWCSSQDRDRMVEDVKVRQCDWFSLYKTNMYAFSVPNVTVDLYWGWRKRRNPMSGSLPSVKKQGSSRYLSRVNVPRYSRRNSPYRWFPLFLWYIQRYQIFPVEISKTRRKSSHITCFRGVPCTIPHQYRSEPLFSCPVVKISAAKSPLKKGTKIVLPILQVFARVYVMKSVGTSYSGWRNVVCIGYSKIKGPDMAGRGCTGFPVVYVVVYTCYVITLAYTEMNA